jgi:hypothetical protein
MVREPLPASSVPLRPRPTPWRVVGAVLLGGILIPFLAFAISGTLVTIGVFVLPALAIAAVLYLVWSSRRAAERDAGLTANPPETGASRVGPRGGTYG